MPTKLLLADLVLLCLAVSVRAGDQSRDAEMIGVSGAGAVPVNPIEPASPEVWANQSSEARCFKELALALMMGGEPVAGPAVRGAVETPLTFWQPADTVAVRDWSEGMADLLVTLSEEGGSSVSVHRFLDERGREAATLGGVFRTAGSLAFTMIGTSDPAESFLPNPGNDS